MRAHGHTRRGRLPAALLVALALAVAGCGSTAQVGGSASGLAAAPDGSAGSADGEFVLGSTPGTGGDPTVPAPAAGDAPAQAGPDGVVSPGRSRTQAGGSGAPAPTTGDTSGSSGPRAVASGVRGVDAGQIKVGVQYTADGSAGNEAIGAGGVTQGDGRRQWQALFDWANARGGVAGRKLAPVWHGVEAVSGETTSARDQAMCTTFTQDDPVFVTFAFGLGGDDTFLRCMGQAGVPIVTAARVDDDDTFRNFPLYVPVLGISNDTIARIWPGGLRDGDYFKSDAPTGVKVGLVTYDMPTFRHPVERTLVPAMKAIGREVADVAYVSYPSTYDQIGGMAAQMANTVLRFRQQGISHVMIFDSINALITFTFMTAAENQGYQPRYGLNSYNGGQMAADELGLANQMRNAVSVAWNPLFDVPEGDYDDWGPGSAECDRIFADAGITFDSRNARGIGYQQCDTMRAFVAGMAASSGPLSGKGVIEGLERLGSSFDSGLYGPLRLGPDRHFGLSRYRLAHFSQDCACWRYTGPWRQMP